MSKQHGNLLMVLLTVLVLNPAMAQTIYKTVDENGNVVFSDTDLSGEGVEVKLRELSVVKPGNAGVEQAGVADSGSADSSEAAQAANIGLRIVSPQPEETIRNTAYVLSAAVEAADRVPDDAVFAYFIDGQLKQTSRSTRVQLEQIFRGEHQLRVELRASGGRVLSSAGPVTFFMRQGGNGG
ncbi:MAG: DUF4124 domain-containing protein [Wenzhouxiangellaceae bacterium]|nr:DUF4124 domain-containing protein [Wenzhouxiangellaceae bacterium]